MVLKNISTTKKFITMDWECAFVMQWPNILKGVSLSLKMFRDPEIKAGEPNSIPVSINPADRPAQASILVVKGECNTFGCPIQLRFLTGTRNVRITVPVSVGWPTDYSSLAQAAGMFMDVLELRMYAGR